MFFTIKLFRIFVFILSNLNIRFLDIQKVNAFSCVNDLGWQNITYYSGVSANS